MNILDFLFPRCCLGCGKKGRYFCDDCLQRVEPASPQIYPVRYPLDGLISLFAYQGLIRQAIIKLKYHFVADLADEIVNLAFRLNEKSFSDFNLDDYLLVSVPLHWRRRNWRGFNQSEVLGRKLAQKLKIKFAPDLLIRKRLTQPQVKLKQKERRQNVRAAFDINYKIYKNYKHYIVFDDVWTTGATMKECARVLKKAGAKKVLGLTLAR